MNRLIAALMIFTAAVCQVANGFSDPVGDTGQVEEIRLADRVCGPRCVQWVLQRYGIDVDLIALIQEMQWPDFEQGSSFADIEKALRQRGLCIHAVEDPTVGDWGVPVIIQERRVGESVPHFAIVDPELGYWDPGLLDFADRNPNDYAGKLIAVVNCPPPEMASNTVIDWCLGLTAVLLFVAATRILLV
jgi:hypothetical protein